LSRTDPSPVDTGGVGRVDRSDQSPVAEPRFDLTFTVCLEDAGEFDVQHDNILSRVYAETRHVSPITPAFEHKKNA
jgi:hypothetical protein